MEIGRPRQAELARGFSRQAGRIARLADHDDVLIEPNYCLMAVRAGRVKAPIEDIPLDHDGTRDLAKLNSWEAGRVSTSSPPEAQSRAASCGLTLLRLDRADSTISSTPALRAVNGSLAGSGLGAHGAPFTRSRRGSARERLIIGRPKRSLTPSRSVG